MPDSQPDPLFPRDSGVSRAIDRARYFRAPAKGDDFEPILALYKALRRALTAKTEDLGPEERLKQPVFIPIRPAKDPREIRILDPACGSGHFLLYGFALLLIIYEEAWEQGIIDGAEFGVREVPEVRPDSVRLDPQANPRSNDSGEVLALDRAYVVVTEAPDAVDGIEAHVPYIIDEATTFRVPFRARVPLRQFDYARGLNPRY